MSRYLYGASLILILVLAALFFYRTPPVTEPLSPTAEFGGVSLRIEYATTSAAREKGLSGRRSVERDYGMLFVFKKDATYGFWMKDMLVPIDMFWLDAQGQVVTIAENVATSTYPAVFYPTSPARFVLETIAGYARAHNVERGTKLMLKKFPTVSE